MLHFDSFSGLGKSLNICNVFEELYLPSLNTYEILWLTFLCSVANIKTKFCLINSDFKQIILKCVSLDKQT